MTLRGFIFIISLVALAYEVLLVKILHLTQLSILVATVISLALLGYAISGVFLAVIKKRIEHGIVFIGLNGLLFSLLIPIALRFSNMVPVNILELFWDPLQIAYLSAMYLILSLPFLCAANSIGFSYYFFKDQIAIIYRYDLMGAALGALSILLLLENVSPSQALYALSIAACTASISLLLKPEFRHKKIVILVAFCSILYNLQMITNRHQGFKISQYTPLAKALTVPQRKVERSYYSSMAMLDVVSEGQIPFRMAKGLSLQYSGEIPHHQAVFKNGKSPGPLYTEDLTPSYLNAIANSLPYKIIEVKVGLTLSATCLTSHLVRHFKIPQMHVIPTNPMKEVILQDPQWKCKHANITYFNNYSAPLRSSKYDLIEIPIESDLTGGSFFSKGHFLTTEAIVKYLDAITPNGIIAIHQEIDLPPKRSLKVVNTITRVLKDKRIITPQNNIVVIRTLDTTLTMLKKQPFTELELDKIRKFCNKNSFDLVHMRGLKKDEVNLSNRLNSPLFYNGVRELLSSSRKDYTLNYQYNIAPSTDDTLNFNHFFKWSTFAKAMDLKKVGGLPQIGWNYPVSIISLALALLLGTIFIIIPLLFIGTKSSAQVLSSSLYFILIGAGFLTIEITLIHFFALYLGDLIYSVTLCLSGILCFAGIGGGYAKKISEHQYKILMSTLLFILGIYSLSLPTILSLSSHYHFMIRVLIMIGLLAPMTSLMGMLFPRGMLKLSMNDRGFIPWAWGLNGLAMVVSSISGSILIIHIGAQMTFLIGVLFYIGAATIYYRGQVKL